MEGHLGYEKYSRSEIENDKNGVSKKKLMTDTSILKIEVT